MREGEKEDLLPARPHRIIHILLIQMTPSRLPFVFVCLFVVCWGITHLNASDSGELAHCSLLELCLVSIIYLFDIPASVNKAAMGLHSDLSSAQSFTLFCVSSSSPTLDPALSLRSLKLL